MLLVLLMVQMYFILDYDAIKQGVNTYYKYDIEVQVILL